MDRRGDSGRRSAWSAYWASGALHSCVGSWAGNYGGAIGAFWRDVFAALPDGTRVLDVATGNGALPRLLLESRPDDAALRIDAVDLAALAPAADDTGRLHFHAGVAAESLPFPDAAFDLVVSQFGFEYAGRDAALAECLRVLAPGGRLAFVMHHRESVLASVARAEVANLDRLLAGDGLLAAAEAVAPWLALARGGGDPGRHPAAAAAREAYNRAQRSTAAAIAASTVPDALIEARDRLQRLLAATGADAAPVRAAIERMRRDCEGARLRSAELVDCALDEPRVHALQAALRAARPAASVDVSPLAQSEGVLGWALRLRPDGAQSPGGGSSSAASSGASAKS